MGRRGGATRTRWGGWWGGVLVISCGIFECVVIAIVGIIGLLVSGSCAARLPRWEGAPVCRAIWQWRGGV